MKTLLLSLMLASVAIPLNAQETRPICNRGSYCWDARQMDRVVECLKTCAPRPPDDLPLLVAGISPHADYRDAGRAYYPLFQKISAPEVVIFGVTHRKTREKLGQPQDKLIFDSYADWQGPYGKIRVSPLREYIEKRLQPRYWMVSDEAQRMDHSIEALLPWLQNARKDVRIVPIMVTAMSFDTMDAVAAKLAEILAGYMRENRLEPGRDIFFLISADANHYGKDFNNTHFGQGAAAHQKATAHDRQLLQRYLQGAISTAKLRDLCRQLWGKNFQDYGDVVWCGQYSIPFGLLTVNHLTQKSSPGKHLTGRLLLYSDSYSDGLSPAKDIGLGPGTPSSLGHWVGYFSAAFYVQ
jgi:AmmeMemoRadiSam system protein B